MKVRVGTFDHSAPIGKRFGLIDYDVSGLDNGAADRSQMKLQIARLEKQAAQQRKDAFSQGVADFNERLRNSTSTVVYRPKTAAEIAEMQAADKKYGTKKSNLQDRLTSIFCYALVSSPLWAPPVLLVLFHHH